MAEVWSLSDTELFAELSHIFAQEQVLAARRLALVREVDGRGLATRHGATSVVAWLRDVLRVSPHAARRMLDLARALDSKACLTSEALADGVINVEQAEVIARAVANLAGHVDPEIAVSAERRLISDAAVFEPQSLAKLATRILDHVAPEIAEEHLRQHLERAEQRAEMERFFALTPDGTGKVRLSGCLPTEAAAIVNAALDPLCAPRVDADLLDPRTPGQRRADALVDVCRLALASGELPDNGGDRPQLTVTMPLGNLVNRIGAGMLDDGQSLSPETVRRIACDAAIIPAVLGGQGQLLDLGRERRLFTGPIRRALVLRDGGCAFPGCDRPARWSDGHHIQHWADGGATNLAKVVNR